MPIVPQLIALPNPQTHFPPGKRRCSLCSKLGAYLHGFYFRTPPHGYEGGDEPIEVPRLICWHCRRTFSLLPRFVMRRVRASLPFLLLDILQTSWMKLFHQLGIAWNTIGAWKRLGKALLDTVPAILEVVPTWADLSTHLSRWQYPKNLRHNHSTIP